jgi:polar amino acid transport system permease protein
MGDLATVWAHADLLAEGLLNTIILALVGATAALVFGSVLVVPLVSTYRPLRLAVQTIVDLLRCVPFLLLAYLVYYGLPSLGIDFDNWTTGLGAIAIYNTAYMAEILRSAWTRMPREGIEAATAFGFRGPPLFLRIVLPPLFLTAAPTLGNQLIQIIKDTAFLTIIAVPELTHAASSIQSQYFVPFAAFLVAVLLYWMLCLVVEGGVFVVERLAEVRR